MSEHTEPQVIRLVQLENGEVWMFNFDHTTNQWKQYKRLKEVMEIEV